MERNQACAKLYEVLDAYFEESLLSCEPYGNGHINDTFLVVADRRYILQRMNHVAFPHPEELMENILGVTSHIRRKAEEEGRDPRRITLQVVNTREGGSFSGTASVHTGGCMIFARER